MAALGGGKPEQSDQFNWTSFVSDAFSNGPIKSMKRVTNLDVGQ